ncbi:hypothetical protein EDD15DRAFT_1506387 [Pisolithus albus]|nr:hypothetical protein EDD15DRAFT_1506387 [Pisolithus albus]
MILYVSRQGTVSGLVVVPFKDDAALALIDIAALVCSIDSRLISNSTLFVSALTESINEVDSGNIRAFALTLDISAVRQRILRCRDSTHEQLELPQKVPCQLLISPTLVVHLYVHWQVSHCAHYHTSYTPSRLHTDTNLSAIIPHPTTQASVKRGQRPDRDGRYLTSSVWLRMGTMMPGSSSPYRYY